ncbi:MAG: ATP-grasp domain-containing protein [Oscillospiraceae bacterium]|nr:ATP-grasp domain-containing protein [Oscillospiraceae bacterium]
MKAFVLAGGFPQIDLIQKLKARGIETLLADYYQHPVARDYADRFFRVSTLDVEAIRRIAAEEKVDFLITVCTDQALLTVAQVSEELGLPCYIDFQTARNVTNKAYMKRVFQENGIPTARHRIVESAEEAKLEGWSYPLIVKPVDCNSSKGVCKVREEKELDRALADALALSRSRRAVVEEFMAGEELSLDVYVENGTAHILDLTTSEKLNSEDKFVIYRTWHRREQLELLREEARGIAQQIAAAFGIQDAPMLIQMIRTPEGLKVIEFSARTGGGVKHLSILRQTGFDVVSAVIDLTLGAKPRLLLREPAWSYMIDEYIYCRPGVFSHLQGFEPLKREQVLLDYYQFRWEGSVFDGIANSGDRAAGFSFAARDLWELREKHERINRTVRVCAEDGSDMMRHDLSAPIRFDR